MRYNKKGVSDVVVVLIIVALAIVAIGIVWRVILPIFTEGTENINYGQKCLEVNLKPTSLDCEAGVTKTICSVNNQAVDCTTGPKKCDPTKLKCLTENYECTVDLKRDTGTGDAEFDGVIAVFSDGENEQSVPKATENIEVLSTDSIDIINADEMIIDAIKVKIAVYFLKEDGTKYTCPGTTEYTNT